MVRICDIPEPIRSLALKRTTEYNERYKNLLDKYPEKLVLSVAFTWDETPEGGVYWRQISYKNYIYPNNNSIQKPTIVIKLKSDLWIAEKSNLK